MSERIIIEITEETFLNCNPSLICDEDGLRIYAGKVEEFIRNAVSDENRNMCGSIFLEEREERFRVDNLQAENERLRFVVSKFEEWYCNSGCPWTETKDDFCPCFDGLKKEYDEEMAEIPEVDRPPFCPSDDCEHHDNGDGWCYARYYEWLFDRKKGGEK